MENKDRAKFIKHRKIIAIDPGANGGIAVYSLTDNKIIEVDKLPQTPQELLSLLRFYQFNSVCYLEHVQGIPGMGAGQMFTFGKGFGQLEMALIACKIPTVEVTPQKWQKELQLGHKGSKTTTQWKNKLKTKAQQLFPNVGKITLATSDSLLILKYGLIQEKR
jgi:hypothetical protein